MKRATIKTTEPLLRPDRRGDAPGSRCDQAERYRATARHIVVQLDIEAAMWRMLGKPPE